MPHFLDEVRVVQRVEIICSRSESEYQSWFKPSSYDSESIEENRTGQPVGRGNLWGAENIPEEETIQWELGVRKINLDLSQGLDGSGLAARGSSF